MAKVDCRIMGTLSATGSTTKIYVGDLDQTTLVVQVYGTYVGTAQPEGSMDGTNWYAWGTALTDAAGAVAAPGNKVAQYLRITFTRTSGSFTAVCGGTPV